MADQDQYSIADMCHVLDVSRSGCYDWLEREESNQSKENRKFLVNIRFLFYQSRQTYGAIRIHHDLVEFGISCSKNREARLMARDRDGLRSVLRQKYKPQTTDFKNSLPIARNVIARDFSVKEPNEKWGCDISYIPTKEGFLYLAIVLDFYSRKIIGFAMRDSMKANLCGTALMMAILLRGPPPKTLIHHSDRGRGDFHG